MGKNARIRQLEAENASLAAELAEANASLEKATKAAIAAARAAAIKQRPWWQRTRDDAVAKVQDALDRVGLGL